MTIGGQATMFRRWITVVALIAGAACSREPASEQAPVASIYTVNEPLRYFASRIAPEGARIALPVPAGADPAHWKPSAEVISGYQQASAVLLNGADYAGWTRYATLPKERASSTAEGCRESFIRTDKSVRHQHGPEGAHTHGDVASTTWLDFALAACQAGHVHDALSKVFTNDGESMSRSFEELKGDLLELDGQMKSLGKDLQREPLLASHPVYQYLADAYGLSIRSLELEPDRALTTAQWKAIDSMLGQESAKVMLWEAAPLASTQAGLKERGVVPVVFDPVANTPADGDFLEVMRANVARLGCATGRAECR